MAEGTKMEAFIEGLRDGGCEFVANYPGTYSQDIFFKLGGDRISINEKTAFERAYGVSLAGKRSLVTMKNVGLNTCADPYLHSVITGVNGGFVVVVTDDTKVTGSQEREDSRHFIDFFGGLWLEPNDHQSAYTAGYDAFELSEKLDIPITIRLSSQFFGASADRYQRNAPRRIASLAKKSPEKMIAYPIYWKRQADNLLHKNKRISEYVERQYAGVVRGESHLSVIACGDCTDEMATVHAAGSANIMQVRHYPLPFEAINRFIGSNDSLTIFEQGDGYVAEKVLADIAKRQNSLHLISNTGESPDLPQQWKVWDHLENLFKALSAHRPSFVVGDVGQYTVESQYVIDACLCLGSSVGVTLGVAESGEEYPYCVVGDGSLLHGNVPALQEAVGRHAAFGIVVIDNGGAMATGGQPLVVDIRSSVPPEIPSFEIDYTTATVDDFQDIFRKMRDSGRMCILYVKLKQEDS